MHNCGKTFSLILISWFASFSSFAQVVDNVLKFDGSNDYVNLNSMSTTLSELDRGAVVSQLYDGALEDLRIWNVTRSAAEIADNMLTDYLGKF